VSIEGESVRGGERASERASDGGRGEGRKGGRVGVRREGESCRIYYLMTCDMCGLNFVIYPDRESEMA
jgi:hypothetical protein